LPDEARYWPQPVPPSPNPPRDAIELLKQSVDTGATLIAIGPYTNLYLLDQHYPGTLARADLYLMGGYVYPPRPGYPPWGNQDDFNVQVDVRSAHHVMRHASPTLTPLTVTAETALRHADLDTLRREGGVLGHLIARQAVEFAADEQIAAKYAATCEHVPEDIINFHHDPLACAVALGWRDGIELAEVPLTFEVRDHWLTATVDPNGKPLRVVMRVDGPRFNRFWLHTVTGKAQ
jgi:inosine-uridine nucleoside N-ribohydrolase